MPASVVLSLDLGTSSCKGALYSEHGDSLGSASAEYPVHRPAPRIAEQKAEDYLDAAREVCRDLAQQASLANLRIAAVGLSTQTPTWVFVDEAGRPVAPSIIWQDTRAEAEANWLRDQVSAQKRLEWFGMDLPPAAASPHSKLLWMARNAKEAWRATRWVLQPKDYVIFALTGQFVSDTWCTKGLCHLLTGEVHPEYLPLLEKDVSPCPLMRRPGEVAGRVTGAASRDWGISEGTPVSVGWSDALGGILATGALHFEFRGFVLTGTSEIIGLSRRAGGHSEGLYLVPASLLDLFGLELHFGPTQAGGASLAWLAGLLGKTVEETVRLVDLRVGGGLNPIVFRPYLYGERAPYWDHSLSASFHGLRGEHGLPDVVHAVLQGVALQERLVLDRAERGHESREVVLAGGAARDRRWNQLRADILQRRLIVLNDMEASLRGAALLAWAASDRACLLNPDPRWFAGEEVFPDPALAKESSCLLDRFRL